MTRYKGEKGALFDVPLDFQDETHITLRVLYHDLVHTDGLSTVNFLLDD